MGEEGQSGPRGVSKREIAAAWACCGLVLLGAIFADLGAKRDDSATATYAGAHIPGGGGQRPRGPQGDDDPVDNPAGEIRLFADDAAPVAIASAEILAKNETAGGRKRESRHCRYTLRQSSIRYSAAARLADAGAVSGVREAAQ